MLLTHGGGLAKEIALRVPLSAGPDAHPTTLLHVLLRWLELAVSRPRTGDSDDALASNGEGGSSPGIPGSNGIVAEGGEGSAEALDEGEGGRSPSPFSPAGGGAGDGGTQAAADMSISLMRLLCGWLYGCPAAVRELLDNPSNLFVVDVAAGRCSLLEEGSPGAGARKATASARTGGGGASPGGGGWRGKGGEAGAEGRGATAAQLVAVKGLACLTVGLLLEYVQVGASPPASGGSGGGGEWTRDLVMKIIQNRVGEFSCGGVGLGRGEEVVIVSCRFFTVERYDLCGHKLRDRDVHRKYSKEVSPCNDKRIDCERRSIRNRPNRENCR